MRSVREGRDCTVEGPKAILMTSTFILRWEPLGQFEQRMDMDRIFVLTESFQLMHENTSEKSQSRSRSSFRLSLKRSGESWWFQCGR